MYKSEDLIFLFRGKGISLRIRYTVDKISYIVNIVEFLALWSTRRRTGIAVLGKDTRRWDDTKKTPLILDIKKARYWNSVK